MSPSIGNWLSRERSSSWPSCSISCVPAASPIKRGDLTTEDTKNRNGLEFGVRLNGPHGVAPNPELRTPSPERISPQRHRGHQESKWIRVGRQVEWPAQCGSEPQTPNPERISPLRNNENYLCPSITRKKKISKNWLPGLLQKKLRGASSCVGQRNSVFRPPC